MNGFREFGHQGSGCPGVGSEGGEPARKITPFDELHAEIALTVMFADFVYWDDAGMIEQGNSLGLELEASEIGVVGKHARLDHLESDWSIQANLTCLVDNSHAPATELVLKLVIAEVADQSARGEVT